MCAGSKENKETSAAEIKAAAINKATITNRLIITETGIAKRIKLRFKASVKL